VRTTARVIVFAGHVIDRPGRPEVRFAHDRVEAARTAIRARLLEEKRRAGCPLEGIAGGAAGGDILFHEVCAEPGVNIPTRLLLALPTEAYIERCVEYAGAEWTERFWALCERLTPIVLEEAPEPRLARTMDEPDTVWVRNNAWLLRTALARKDAEITLFVLWDGKAGDGPGGTAAMVSLAQRWALHGLSIVHLDPLTFDEIGGKE
jgi:hypothetical protein